ncbi:MAG: ribonuclease Z [Clostridiales bacterium]|jgi:ribonuclease Z|nr:ribonuclease Z [Clostridiales bacterium]
MIDISLFGTGGMVPLPERFLTGMAARLNGKMLLVDCGEGTQITLKKLGWGYKFIDFICFTHFHADHIAGLPGLLLTIGNSGKTEPLTVIGPPGVEIVVKNLCVIAPELPFEINFKVIPVNRGTVRLDMGDFMLSCLPLAHRINCLGYSIEVPRAGKFDVARAKAKSVPLKLWKNLQKGEIIEFDGIRYTPDMVLGPRRKGLKVSYITDTRPTNAIPDFIAGSDLFICEGLYGDRDKQEKAASHSHMIFSEAALLAQKGNVKELWLTHFSPAMPDPGNYIDNAKTVFENVKIGQDRMTKTITFEET